MIIARANCASPALAEEDENSLVENRRCAWSYRTTVTITIKPRAPCFPPFIDESNATAPAQFCELTGHKSENTLKREHF